MFHITDCKQAQFLQLTSLSLIDEVSSLERRTAERAAIIALDGKSPVKNKVSARKCRSLETCLLAKDVGDEGD